MNYPTNWDMPVQLCNLLEEHLTVPVQLITWGHPNLGRNFREHQINIFAVPFEIIGFSLPHKQTILEEFIKQDKKNYPNKSYSPCPGRRKLRKQKPKDSRENSDKLDDRLNGKHFNAYWQICKKLGCPRTSKIFQKGTWQKYGKNASEETKENEI